VFLLILSAALSAPFFDTHGITPELVASLIKEHGAKQAVQLLAEHDPADVRINFGDYDTVLDGVASGDPRWLALVPRLDPGTDAGTAEALRIAVAKALPKNPMGVLSLVSREPSWRDVCSSPMIEPTSAETRAYFQAAISAVTAVKSPKVSHAKVICLTELRKLRRAP